MTDQEVRAELDRLRVEGDQILSRSGSTLADDDAARITTITSRVEELTAELEVRDRRNEAARALGRGHVEHGDGAAGVQHLRRQDPWEQQGHESAGQVRSRALSAVERWAADDELKGSATATIERLDRSDMGGVSAHILRFSHPLYCSAFRKYASDPETYAAVLTPEERQVWIEAREYQRAALATSGAVLPSPLDPTITLTNSGAVDPMRALARVDTTTSKTKRYITSAGSTFSFDAELAEVSDDSFAEAEVTITNHKAQGFIQASIEVWEDQPNFSTEVAKIIGDGKARLEASKFITGTGTNEPFGIEVALNATASEINSTSEDLTAVDTYGLLAALPPRFRQNAAWQLELSTLHKLHRLYNPTGTEPPLVIDGQLLMRPFQENSSVDPYSAVNAAATASNRVLFVGDWSNYVVLDRVGLSVAFLGPGQLLNTTTNLPDGRVGWYAYWRVGANVLTAAAFRMLDVATAA